MSCGSIFFFCLFVVSDCVVCFLPTIANVLICNQHTPPPPPPSQLLEHGAKSVVLMSHLGRPNGERVADLTLAPVAEALQELLGKPGPSHPPWLMMKMTDDDGGE